MADEEFDVKDALDVKDASLPRFPTLPSSGLFPDLLVGRGGGEFRELGATPAWLPNGRPRPDPTSAVWKSLVLFCTREARFKRSREDLRPTTAGSSLRF